MSVVTAPVVTLPRHQVTTDELLDRITELYEGHPGLAVARRVIRSTTVRARWYTRPLEEQFDDTLPLAERTCRHLEDSLDLAEKAARGALVEAGLTAADIDGLVVLSATGHTMPGLDVLLMERLDLPPSVRRIPVTQVGCGGGVFALVRAMDMVAAHPGATVLVVCADVFSHYLHRGDTGLDGMILKGLFGDAAGACVVRPEAQGPRMELTHSWEYLHPDSRDLVGSRTEGDGLHAYNSPKLRNVIEGTMPRILEWLERVAPPGTDPVPRFVVSHTGGPRILDAIVGGLGCDPAMVDLARDSLRELGNVGSVSVLDVLERTFVKSPAEGDHGLVLAAGPGVSLFAARAVWRPWQ
ncbi:type III polyketide synthase [Streptomyces siamensis]|uniref:1,3,6,8-tetrahydroxynaphthalene synthase n=1 Tax=Streptomyces siamensis TaxID=1274986 RepID=A0ABP9IYN0_9ACTN